MDESRVGPFALEEKLGDAASSVYRAVHLKQRRQVALKVFPLPLAANLHGRLLFADEMALLKRLVHPRIVRCYGGNLEERHGYIACEIVEGESLTALLARRGRLGWETTVDYALGICEALHAAQELELTHLDLSPDKVLIAADGKVKVADFRQNRPANPLCISSQVRSLRRVTYQAPEQIRPGGHVTHRTDLYALGCILFEMLAGRPPFVGDSVNAVAEAHLGQVPPRVMSLALDCPIWLDALVAQLLEKEPLRRPHSAEAVILALEETKRKVAAGAGVTQHALGGISALKVPVNKGEVRELVHGSRRDADEEEEGTPLLERPWVIAAGMVLLVAVLGFLLSIPFWPVDEKRFIEEADKLMASSDPKDWHEARRSYLDPLLARNPDGPYAERARAHIDKIEMQLAENRLRTLRRLGREPETEAQRLYVEALAYEEFGDEATALEKYQSLSELVAPEGEDRLMVLLARRRIEKLKSDRKKPPVSSVQFIEAKLAEADALTAQGKAAESRRILQSLRSLYGDHDALEDQMEQVRRRLDQQGGQVRPAETDKEE
jgi:hypothetical protein